MTDRTDDLPPGKVLMPEVIEEPFEPALAPETAALINDTISFINQTVSAKALETALLIGDYILTNYFDDDIESAFSRDSNKPVSFNIMCEHPELNISRQHLVNMVKVAAQERFFQAMDFNFSSLHYTHRVKLTLLPNDESKVEMARECIKDDLTTRQLAYRVRMKVTAPDVNNELPDETSIDNLISSIEQTIRKVELLELTSFNGTISDILNGILPDKKILLESRLMTLIETMGIAQEECNALLMGFMEKDRGLN